MWFVGFAHPQTPVIGLVGRELRPSDPAQLFALIDAVDAPPALRDHVIVASRSPGSAAVFTPAEQAGSIAMFSEMMQLAAADIVGDEPHEIVLAEQHRPARLAAASPLAQLAPAYMKLRFPTNADEWPTVTVVQRARALWGIGERDRAIVMLETACATSTNAVDHFQLGELLTFELERPAEAIVHLRRAVALAPDRSEPHTTLAIALVTIGDADGAIASALRATELVPEDAAAWANLAECYACKRDDARMREAAQRAQSLEPGEPMTAALLGKR